MTFDDLLETARLVPTTNEAREAQRRSFVYGNLKIDNDAITRELVDDATRDLDQLQSK